MTAATGNRVGKPDAEAFFKLHWPAVEHGLELGLSFESASKAAGISADTLTAWRVRYPSLSEDILRARERGKQRLLEQIAAHGPKDYRAAAWLLERTPGWREDYGQQVRIDVRQLSVQLDARLEQLGVDATTLDSSDRDAIIASIARQLAPPR